MRYPVTSCYFRLLCAVRSDSARVRGGRDVDVSSMQSSLTVSGDDGRDQLLSHLSGADVEKIMQTCARNISLVPMKAYGGVHVKFYAFLTLR